MFTTYYSDSLEILALIGGRIMKGQKGGDDLFLNEVIVTQNSGMFTYVKQVMTSENGIFAQTRNVRLWNFVWELARAVLTDFPKEAEETDDFDVYSRDALKWNLAGVLSGQNSRDDDKIKYLREYLNRPDISEAERELRVYDLADSLADVYDKYQIYRSDWISWWTESSPEAAQELRKCEASFSERNRDTFRWEGDLWRILENNVKGAAGEQPRISRSRIIRELGDLLRKTDPASAEGKRISEVFSEIIPGRVFIYGISSVPPEILDILIALGRFVDVHFMFLNPCREYWGDIRPISKKEIRERINRITSYQLKARSGNLKRELLAAAGEESGIPSGENLPIRETTPKERNIRFDKTREIFEFDYDSAKTPEELRKADEELRDMENSLQNAGNPLLLSFGRRGRDTMALITDKTAGFAEQGATDRHGRSLIREVFAYEQDYRDENGKAEPDSILEKIRRDIFRLDNSAIPDDIHAGKRTPVNTEKPSLTVTSCPTRLREVQVLYDQILSLFDRENGNGSEPGQNPDADDDPLLPRDIIVMAPNISVYAPFIEGVFRGGNESLKAKYAADGSSTGSNGREGRSVALPIAICDRSMNDQNPVLTGVRTLLSISDPGRIWSAHDVVSLFNIEEVRQKFGFSEDDVREIGNLLHDNYGVLGLDAGDTRKFSIPETADGNTPLGQLWDFTLKQGADRLVMGSMMPCDGSDNKPWNAESEGDRVRIIGSFAEFLTRLTDLKKALSDMSRRAEDPGSGEPLTMDDWYSFIRTRILDVFFRLGDQGAGIISYLRKAFSDAAAGIAALERKPRLTLSLTLRFFDDVLGGSDDRRSPFLRNAINFCTFVPMRSIPFKHVFMLGMNDGDFPANPAVPGFDLMNEIPKAGDRNRPDDDRYMFLEAVLAARKSLHISYLGISPGDGSEKNPSVVVSELTDYVMASMKPSDEDMAAEMKRNGNPGREINPADLFRKNIFFRATLNPSDRANYIRNRSSAESREGAGDSCGKSSGINRFWSYQEQWFMENTGTAMSEKHAIGEGIYPAGRLEPAGGRLEIPAKDLLKFIKDPEKYFLTRKLGISEDYSKDAPAHESFGFGFLQEGNLLLEVVRMNDAEREGFRELQIRKGAFPAGMAGDYAWNGISQKIAVLNEAVTGVAQPLPAMDEITLDEGIPDYAAVCIEVDKKQEGKPFVPSGEDWQYWDIPELAAEMGKPLPEDQERLPWRDLLTEYRNSCGDSVPSVKIRITGISEVSGLLRRNFMFDPWNKDGFKFKAMMKICAALYTLSSQPDAAPAFYAIDKTFLESDASGKKKEPQKLNMDREQASRIMRWTAVLYLLGQIAPLSLDSGNGWNESKDSGTGRDFRNAEKTLFYGLDNDAPRNFSGIGSAFNNMITQKGKKAEH